jgi:hypothetical protein
MKAARLWSGSFEVVSPSDSIPDVERRFQSRDAWQSTFWLALLVVAAWLVVLATSWEEMPRPMRRVFIVDAGAALATIAYLVAARRRVQPRIFAGLALALALSMVAVIPLATVQWSRIGRPFEMLWSVRLAMGASALVVPRSYVLGLTFTLIALLNVPLTMAIAREMGTPRERLLLGEPIQSFLFAIAAVALLLLAHRRRSVILRYLRLEAEADALRRLAAELRAVAGQLDTLLDRVSALLSSPTSAPARPGLLRAMNGASSRLADVRDRLVELGATGADATAAAAAPVPGGAAPSAASALTAAEQELFARDAHNGALTLAIIAALCGPLAAFYVFAQLPSRGPSLCWIGVGVLGLAATAVLLRTRRRPSTGRALWLVLVLVAAALPSELYANAIVARHTTQPFEPYQVVKFLILIVPLILPRWRLLGALLEATLAAATFGMFYWLHLSALRARVPLVEPWAVLLFAGVGFALILQREQRQAASLRLLRAQRELAALARRAGLCLALGDQINSPLQALLFGIAVLKAQNPGEAATLDQIVEQLREVSSSLPNADDLVQRGLGSLTFAGARELVRRA